MKNYEMLLIPTKSGLIKVYIYHFLHSKNRVKVYAMIHDQIVSSTGYNKKRTVINALGKLYKSIIAQD